MQFNTNATGPQKKPVRKINQWDQNELGHGEGNFVEGPDSRTGVRIQKVVARLALHRSSRRKQANNRVNFLRLKRSGQRGREETPAIFL